MVAIATAAAAALAGRAAESLGEGARQAVGALVARIKGRFGGSPDEPILELAAASPDDERLHALLAAALGRAAADDPEFAAELTDLGRRAGVLAPVQAQQANVVNAQSIGTSMTAGRDITINTLNL